MSYELNFGFRVQGSGFRILDMSYEVNLGFWV